MFAFLVDLGKNNDIKKLDFIYTEYTQYQYLLVITYNENTKNYNCKIMDPYGLEYFIDNTNYFHEHVIKATTEGKDIFFGPVLSDNKILMVDDGQIYVKTIVSGEILDDVQQMGNKNNYFIYVGEMILEIFKKASDYTAPPKLSIKTGKSIQWLAGYNDKYLCIIIKAQKFDNKTEMWKTVVEHPIYYDEKFVDCKLLIDDDLFLITSEAVRILSLNDQTSKIFTKFIKTEYFFDETAKEERLEKIRLLEDKNNIEKYLFDFIE